MRRDDHGQRQGGQRRYIEPLADSHSRKHGRQRREPCEIDRKNNDEDIADEKFRNRNGDQGQDIGDPIGGASLIDRRYNAKADGDRHSDDRGIAGEEQRVLESRQELFDNDALVGQRLAEITVQNAEQPAEISDIGRLIEPELGSEHFQRVRRRLLAEHGRGDVAREDLGADENQHRNREKSQDPKAGPCCDET
jgi:hypothetical protein